MRVKKIHGKIVHFIGQSFKVSTTYDIRALPFYFKRYGFTGFFAKLKSKIKEGSVNINKFYPLWINENEPGETELQEQRSSGFAYSPLISIAVPVYRTPLPLLEEMINSVVNQTYPNWELCIADGGSGSDALKKVLEEYASKDERIKLAFLEKNLGIALNSNKAIELAGGDFVALLDHDDTLAPFALYETVGAVNENPEADFIYSDEDKITENGKNRFDPHFKPDFSPDLLRSYNYITHLSVVKRTLLNETGCFREGFEGGQDYDLILRITEKARKIIHIPKILYHWRISRSSAAGSNSAKPYAEASAKKALTEHLERTGLKGVVEHTNSIGHFRIIHENKGDRLISIIIPNKDNPHLLNQCINSIKSRTSYKNYEVVIVENNSSNPETFNLYDRLSSNKKIKIIEWNKEFNYSAVNNFGAENSDGSTLLFLNNDTEVISGGWLKEMSSYFSRKNVGAVGSKLYFPGNHIQHAGIIIGMTDVAGHPFANFPRESEGYMHKLEVTQNLSAVTGACMMTPKEVFESVGGFDPGYPLAFGDVDYCLNVREKGFLIIFTPHAELYHYETATRGHENTVKKQERYLGEVACFKKRWGKLLENGDPYYNPNLALNREDFSLKLK